MDPFMGLHIGLLNKGLSTKATLVFLSFRMDFFVSFQGANSGELFAAKLAREASELSVGFDVRWQVPFTNFFIAHLAFHVLKSMKKGC